MSSSEQVANDEIGPLARALHLVALCGFACAQPLFDVLKAEPSFFVVRGTQPVDFWLFTVGLILCPALLLFAVEYLAGRVSRTLQAGLHLVWIALLAGLTIAPVLSQLLVESGLLAAGIALLGGGLVAAVYRRWSVLRTFLDMLSPAPLVFAAIFLSSASIAKLAFPSALKESEFGPIEAKTSLVYIVLDELPLTSLLTSEGEIDARLFPNFARLARTSTWFCNATASNIKTELILPALLTGQMPEESDRLPIQADYPDNVFAWLAAAYRMRIHETVTRLCPSDLVFAGESEAGVGERMRYLADDLAVVYGHIVLPDVLRSRLPAVTAGWGDFRGERDAHADSSVTPASPSGSGPTPFRVAKGGRAESVRQFEEAIEASDEPTFYFLHVLLPHSPWNYLPSGARYRAGPLGLGNKAGRWRANEGATELAFQRHLFQLGYTDRLLGRILDQLESTRVFDDAVVVVTADHGIAFKRKTAARRPVDATLRDIIHVPLFFKEAGQVEGRRSERNVQSMDILPTIVDGLGLDLPWPMDGRSALDLSQPESPGKTIYSWHVDTPFKLGPLYPAAFPTVERKLRLFGPNPSWESIFALGSARDRIGMSVSDFARAAPAQGKTVIEEAQRFEVFDPEAVYTPCYVLGRVETNHGPVLRSALLVAVNGVIRAQATLHELGRDQVSFAAMVPDHAFIPGVNRVEVYSLTDDGSLALIPRETMRWVEGRPGRSDRFTRSDGTVVRINGETTWGFLGRATRKDSSLVLAGAGFRSNPPIVADEILIVFADGSVTSAATGHTRHTVSEDDPLYKAGFETLVVISAEDAPGLRLFARIGDGAARLRVPRDFQWGEE